MARLTSSERGQLRHIRNELFKRNTLKGTASRHPDKEATVYTEKAMNQPLLSIHAKRPPKMKGVCVSGVAEVVHRPVNSDAFKNAFEDKLAAMGWTKEDWNLWKVTSKENPSLSLHDYRQSLKVCND